MEESIMLIPRRTKIERTGVVISIASLLAIVIGVLAVTPETHVWASRTSSVTFTNSAAWLDDCFENTAAELPKESQQLEAREATRIAIANTFAVAKACDAKLDKQYVYRPRSFMEYVSAYAHTIATTVTSPETLNMSELLLGGGGPPYGGYSTSFQLGFKVLKLILYWGARFLLAGLFLLYFEPTLGRVLRFIWRGSPSA
jgi:hypothetical protein